MKTVVVCFVLAVLAAAVTGCGAVKDVIAYGAACAQQPRNCN